MSIGLRIKQGREKLGISQAKLAEQIGASQSAIWSWEKERTVPDRKYISAIAKIIGMSRPELEFGEDLYYQDDKVIKSMTIERQRHPVPDDIRMVPEYNIRLSAGGGFVVDEENIIENWTFNESYLKELRLQSAELIVAEVDGDSMEPKLATGDRVMINKSDVDANRPGIFAIWDTSALVIKRIEKIPNSEPVMLRLISDNKNHSHYDVLAEDTRIIGRAVWFARRM